MAKGKPAKFNCEPFPVLSWGGHYWTCQVSIPAWAGYRSFEAKKIGDGTIALAIASDDKTRDAPAESQIAAYRHLRAHAKRIATSILKQIFSNYSNWQLQYADYVTRVAKPKSKTLTKPSEANIRLCGLISR